MKLQPIQLFYIIINNIFTMMELQRMPKDVTEHRHCVKEHISMKVCWLFPLSVTICFKNVQSPMASLCNNLTLLFEFTLHRVMLIYI